MKHPVLFVALMPLAALVAWPAWATAPDTPATPPRPPQLGLCAACHGVHGQAVMPNVPNLAGQNLDYLLKALNDYKTGKRDVAVMKAAVGPLSAKQLEALARWFAAQPPGGSKTAPDTQGGPA